MSCAVMTIAVAGASVTFSSFLEAVDSVAISTFIRSSRLRCFSLSAPGDSVIIGVAGTMTGCVVGDVPGEVGREVESSARVICWPDTTAAQRAPKQNRDANGRQRAGRERSIVLRCWVPNIRGLPSIPCLRESKSAPGHHGVHSNEKTPCGNGSVLTRSVHMSAPMSTKIRIFRNIPKSTSGTRSIHRPRAASQQWGFSPGGLYPLRGDGCRTDSGRRWSARGVRSAANSSGRQPRCTH